MSTYGIHWFRRDLRVAGNPALRRSWKENSGRVVGVFFFDSKFLSRPDFSHHRFAFFLETLRALREELREIGSDLLVLDALPQEGFPRLLETMRSRGRALPSSVSFNRDYEPFARARDEAVTALLEKKEGLKVFTERDHLLLEPGEVAKAGLSGVDAAYSVYSPFGKRWFEKLRTPEVQARIAVQKEGLRYLEERAAGRVPRDLFALRWEAVLGSPMLEDAFEKQWALNQAHVRIPIPKAGSLEAYRQLREFGSRIAAYKEKRDFPAVPATSRFSIFLKNGSLTSGQILAELELSGERFDAGTGRSHFVKEIAWREFYYQILWFHPRVESEAFIRKYKDLAWENREDLFEAWKEGKTGYPIVDAGMRELKATGWMHNRVRMVVASFLTKDLLIDWRWGERYFMEQLLDGDLAPNNGGWQWAASTGCDPQPYFRIFNPALQGEKFDPEGEYVRKWVPELRNAPSKIIHEPHAKGKFPGYAEPVVVHASRKNLALSLFKAEPGSAKET
jgi:deoxyribodipyrimidine photo-lyase